MKHAGTKQLIKNLNLHLSVGSDSESGLSAHALAQMIKNTPSFDGTLIYRGVMQSTKLKNYPLYQYCNKHILYKDERDRLKADLAEIKNDIDQLSKIKVLDLSDVTEIQGNNFTRFCENIKEYRGKSNIELFTFTVKGLINFKNCRPLDLSMYTAHLVRTAERDAISVDLPIDDSDDTYPHMIVGKGRIHAAVAAGLKMEEQLSYFDVVDHADILDELIKCGCTIAVVDSDRFVSFDKIMYGQFDILSKYGFKMKKDTLSIVKNLNNAQVIKASNSKASNSRHEIPFSLENYVRLKQLGFDFKPIRNHSLRLTRFDVEYLMNCPPAQRKEIYAELDFASQKDLCSLSLVESLVDRRNTVGRELSKYTKRN